jgi:hypothetical protein
MHSVCKCMHAGMCIYIYILWIRLNPPPPLFTYLYRRIYVYIYIHTHIHTYIRKTYTHVEYVAKTCGHDRLLEKYAYAPTCVFMYVCMYIRANVCMYVCMYVCIYDCKQVSTNTCITHAVYPEEHQRQQTHAHYAPYFALDSHGCRRPKIDQHESSTRHEQIQRFNIPV